MQKSESIKNLALALLTFQMKVEKIKKDAENPFFKSKYASLSNIQDSIAVPLSECELVYAQFPEGDHGLTTIIIHAPSGESMESTYTMKPVKDDPQGVGSAITYQKRYALTGALGLNIDDDDDGNQATHGSKAPETKDNGLPWLNENTTAFNGAVKKLREGTTTMAKIKLAFKISKETETKLLNLSSPQHAN